MFTPLIHQKPINLRAIKHLIGEETAPQQWTRKRAAGDKADLIRADRLFRMQQFRKVEVIWCD